MNESSIDLFSDLAGEYAAYRPSYPRQLFEYLVDVCPVPSVAADIGSGTGIFARGLLEAGYRVMAIEPNSSMRKEAMAASQNDPTLTVIDGQGEATNLNANSVDLITIAQAFHWLDKAKAFSEFLRIGKPFTRIAIAWNSRQFEASDFMNEYHQMLVTYAPNYTDMKDKYWPDLENDVRKFLPGKPISLNLKNSQCINLTQLIGNLLSASYAPKMSEDGYEQILDAAKLLFDKHQYQGIVTFELKTILYISDPLAEMGRS